MSGLGRLALVGSVLGIVVASMGCAGKKYDPWRIAPERFRADFHVLAMFPVGVPSDLENPRPIQILFDSLVTESLRSGGFTVIPSDSAGGVWQHLVDSAGGLFDARTGERDAVKVRRLQTQWWAAVRDRYHADAVVFPAVLPVAAKFSESSAKWDGTSQGIEGFGGAFVRGLFGQSRSGTTPAVSLRVAIEADGELFYRNQGGIEVVVKPDGGVGEGWNRIPRSELFRDPERNAKAVQIALEPLVGAPR